MITGVPENPWNLNLPEGICIDIVPVGEKGFVVRPYGIDDNLKNVALFETVWMGESLLQWLENED